MAAKKNSTPPSEFVEAPEVAEDLVEETQESAKPTVAPGAPETKKARIKGTWRMYWGTDAYDFEDGNTYTIPTGLYNHLKSYGNIYDTL